MELTTQPRARHPSSRRKLAAGGISWTVFERNYLSREDGYKYEWVNGEVEKSRQTMNQFQLFILLNLRSFFDALRSAGNVTGILEPEIDAFFLERVHRRPDVAYYTHEQAARMAHGINQVPQFVIEIISKTDTAEKVTEKLKNYRDAGVSVVWHIYPTLEEVHEHRGLTTTVHRGDDLCSAAPALPAFELPVSEIFKKPPLPETTP